LTEVAKAMRDVPGVLDVHDLHIWSLGSSTHALSCHVRIEDVPLSASDAILRGLNTVLAGRFNISHTTVQFEHRSCAISANGCAIPVGPGSHRHR
jgi:cobalt-zinc-cadmium efflux system protein